MTEEHLSSLGGPAYLADRTVASGLSESRGEPFSVSLDPFDVRVILSR